MTALSLVAVGDDTLEAVEHDGAIWVPVRRVCEVLGISPDAQRVKLGGKPWSRTAMIAVRDGAGRAQSTYALHLDCLPMWLATIERVRPEVEAKLHRFQREARDVLAAHFVGARSAPPPPAASPVDPILVALLRLARFFTSQGVPGCRVVDVEAILNGGDDVEVTA